MGFGVNIAYTDGCLAFGVLILNVHDYERI
jgi:hypothetical protein